VGAMQIQFLAFGDQKEFGTNQEHQTDARKWM